MREASCVENNIYLQPHPFSMQGHLPTETNGVAVFITLSLSLSAQSSVYYCQESSQLQHIDTRLRVNTWTLDSMCCTCSHTIRHLLTIGGQCVSNYCLCRNSSRSSTDNSCLAITHLAPQTIRWTVLGVGGGGRKPPQSVSKNENTVPWLISDPHVLCMN